MLRITVLKFYVNEEHRKSGLLPVDTITTPSTDFKSLPNARLYTDTLKEGFGQKYGFSEPVVTMEVEFFRSAEEDR